MGRPKTQWTSKEEAVLIARYEHIGPTKCAALLPGKSAEIVRQHARDMGLNRFMTITDNTQPLPPPEPHRCVFDGCENIMEPNDRSGEWSRYKDDWICPEHNAAWSRANQDRFKTETPAPYGSRKDEQ